MSIHGIPVADLTGLCGDTNMQTLTPWTKELPARIGWYNASTDRDPLIRRYWHGTRWSAPVMVGDPDGHADRARGTRGESQFPDIEWRGLTEREPTHA